MPARRLDISDGRKRCSRCHVRKPLFDFFPRPKKAVGVSSACKVCETARSSRYNKMNPSRHASHQREYRARHPARAKACTDAWFARNPSARAEYEARRRAAEIQRTPKWVTAEDRKQMAAAYAEAAFLTQATGIPFEVDHEIPLQGRNVSGLHVPSNLRVVQRTLNRRKSNAWMT